MTAALNSPEHESNLVERYQLGTITGFNQIEASQLGIDANIAPEAIYGVDVSDPYVEKYSFAERAQVKFEEQAANDFAAERREQGKWERKAGTAYYDSDDVRHDSKKGFGDPVSRNKFFNEDLASPAINAWRSKIPSAEALADLSDPINSTHVTDHQGKSVPMDDDARMWLSLCTDAVGIRSRATVMAEVVKNFAEEQRIINGTDLSDFRWLSVACGTALPSIQGAMKAGIRPELLLADFDQKAMSATEQLAAEIGYTGTITRPAQEAVGREGINIFDVNEMSQLKDYLGDNGGRPMLIDLMGIFEYTGENLGVDSAAFLKSCYDMLHPGGKLVFGQMRSDRRVADFTMGVVSWPFIEMRSPAEFMDIIDKSGINPLDTTLFLPSDGVYTVGVISKPGIAKTVVKTA